MKIVIAKNTNDNSINYSNTSLRLPDPGVISDCVEKKIMPDLSNYSIKDAVNVLSKLGIRYKMKGTGMVMSQSPAPGTKIKKGQICSLLCKEISVSGTAVY